MRNLSLVLCLLFMGMYSQSSFASLPEGRWLADNVVADDGAYGSFYKAWLTSYDDNIDQIITLGAHFSKTKFLVLTDNGSVIEAFDPLEKSNHTLTYVVLGDSLKLCIDEGACITYTNTQIRPALTQPPEFHPRTKLSAKWCIQTVSGPDCEVVVYSDYQSENVFSLYQGFKPMLFWQYEGPTALQKKYGLHLSAMTYSFRLKNDGSDLSSFSTTFVLLADNKSSNEILARSGVVILKEGLLTQLGGSFLDRDIEVEFSLAVSH